MITERVVEIAQVKSPKAASYHLVISMFERKQSQHLHFVFDKLQPFKKLLCSKKSRRRFESPFLLQLFEHYLLSAFLQVLSLLLQDDQSHSRDPKLNNQLLVTHLLLLSGNLSKLVWLRPLLEILIKFQHLHNVGVKHISSIKELLIIVVALVVACELLTHAQPTLGSFPSLGRILGIFRTEKGFVFYVVIL